MGTRVHHPAQTLMGGLNAMTNDSLKGKRVLIVDDEPDVLETLKDLLFMCSVAEASNFEDARELLERERFDIAVLDIMGVDGYELLEIAKDNNIPAVMLTANALSVQDTVRSFKGGAASYVPKEEMIHIATFLNDILAARESGKNPWGRWLERLGKYYDKKFGPEWQSSDEEFWKKFKYWL